MLADAAAATFFAVAPLPLVLADAATTAVFALAPPSLVLAEAAAAAVFALAPLSLWCSQMLLPPQSLHLLKSMYYLLLRLHGPWPTAFACAGTHGWHTSEPGGASRSCGHTNRKSQLAYPGRQTHASALRAPSPETDFGWHGWHVAVDSSATATEYVPAAQRWHPVAPASGANVPGWHAAQTEAAEAHTACENEPVAHGRHAEDEGAQVNAKYEPLAQSSHTIAASSEENVLVPQSSHAVTAAAAANELGALSICNVKSVPICAAWNTSRQDHEILQKALVLLLPLAWRTSTHTCNTKGAYVCTGIKKTHVSSVCTCIKRYQDSTQYHIQCFPQNTGRILCSKYNIRPDRIGKTKTCLYCRILPASHSWQKV